MKRFRYKGDLSKHIKRYHPGHTQALTPVPLQEDEITTISLSNKPHTATGRPIPTVVASPTAIQLSTSKGLMATPKASLTTTIGATDNKFFLPLLPKHPVQQSELPGFSRSKSSEKNTVSIITPTLSFSDQSTAPLSNESVLDLLSHDQESFPSSRLSTAGLIQTVVGQHGQKQQPRIQIQQPIATTSNHSISRVSFVVTKPSQGVFSHSSKIGGNQSTLNIMRQQTNSLPPPPPPQVTKAVPSPALIQTTSKLQEALLHGKPRTITNLGRGGERVTIVTTAGITNNKPQTTRFAVPTSTIVKPKQQTVVQNSPGISNNATTSQGGFRVVTSPKIEPVEKPKTLTISISEVFACAQPLPLQEEARQHNKGKMTTMADLELQHASLGPLNAVLQQKGITLATTNSVTQPEKANQPSTLYRQIINPISQANTVSLQQKTSTVLTSVALKQTQGASNPITTAKNVQVGKGHPIPTTIQGNSPLPGTSEKSSTARKAFVCDHSGCNKSFDKANLLRKHAKLHSKQCKFICDVCHKGFESHSKKEDHYRKHTGVKPFLCELCGHSFRYKGNFFCM